MRMRSLLQRAVTAVLGGLSVAACAASNPVAPSAGAAPDPPPRAAARSPEECRRATREVVAREVDGGACESLDSPPPKTSADTAATNVRKSAYADCDPAKANSDGTPKRAPAGPPGRPPETLVLSYDDFAPQASAFKLIGFQWWAWEGGGSWEQCDDFDIRVVVFRGLARKTVEKQYPSATSKVDLIERGLADYRYVEHKAALAHLDAELADIAGSPDLAGMAERLRATRRRIVDALGE
jgi:hypothetical protein